MQPKDKQSWLIPQNRKLVLCEKPPKTHQYYWEICYEITPAELKWLIICFEQSSTFQKVKALELQTFMEHLVDSI